MADDGDPDDEKKLDYEVGYKRPPKATQFKKGGARGNPNGRPKGSKNLATIVKKVAYERVAVKENGRRRSMPMVELSVRQQAKKAANGDPKAFRELISALQKAEGVTEIEEPIDQLLGEADQATFDNLLARLKEADQPDPPEVPPSPSTSYPSKNTSIRKAGKK